VCRLAVCALYHTNFLSARSIFASRLGDTVMVSGPGKSQYSEILPTPYSLLPEYTPGVRKFTEYFGSILTPYSRNEYPTLCIQSKVRWREYTPGVYSRSIPRSIPQERTSTCQPYIAVRHSNTPGTYQYISTVYRGQNSELSKSLVWLTVCATSFTHTHTTTRR